MSVSEPQQLRVVYAGTPEFAVPALKLLDDSTHNVVAVYTQPDRPAGRGRKSLASPVKNFALEHGLPVEQPENFKSDAAIAQLQSYTPDVMVVAAYGVLLPPAVLQIPTFGCLNIHASLLPRWRGAAPLQRAILGGDTVSGASIMLMEEGLDTGPVLARVEVPITTSMTASDLHDAVAEIGATALIDTLPAWSAAEIKPELQSESAANYAKKLQKSEANIDWSDTAVAVHRQIMAFNPWPVAQTFLGDRVIRIWRSRLPDALPDELSAQALSKGRLCSVGTQLFVACSDSWLELLDVQAPGKRAMPVADFLNANDLSGQHFTTESQQLSVPGTSGN